MNSLTARQAEVLAFIRSFLAENGYPPTVREIGRHFGWSSTNAVCDHLWRLEKKGAIRVDAAKSRAIKVLVPA